ncbi:MAG: LamG domain-containing protein [Candidatus Marsarchaeota archaeon]|nr:LamG domain-containing protein [Candidatus Marsarchaeota archaeon]
MQESRKAQIALEFLIVYSIVLVIFLVIFAIIANQRAATLGSQEYASLQLVTEDISSYINQALTAGNGYSAIIQLPVTASVSPYYLYMSSDGAILANSTIGTTLISGTSYSNSRSLIINGSLVGSYGGVNLYSIPTYTGTIQLTNVNGEIYVDDVPPSILGLEGVPKQSQIANSKAANFSVDSQINLGNSSALNFGSQGTIAMWIRFKNFTSPYAWNILSSTGNACINGYRVWATASSEFGFGACNNAGGADIQGTTPYIPGKWYFIVGRANSTSISFFIDGKSLTTATTTTFNTIGPWILGIGPIGVGRAESFNGTIANVQIYNAPLSVSQILQMYNNGIGSSPVNATDLVGWWPLDGNANDYSGYGSYGAPYNITYQNVAEISSSVLGTAGNYISNAPIGYVSSYGMLGNSTQNFITKYANASGVQKLFITANSSIGPDTLTTDFFNGNLSTFKSLVGWWPLDIGYGNKAYDLSGYKNTGTFSNPEWVPVANNDTNFISAQFPGDNASTSANAIEDGFVTIKPSSSLQNIERNGTFTVAAWIYYKGSTSNHMQGIFGDLPNSFSGQGFQFVGGGSGNVLYVNNSFLAWPSGSNSQFPKDRWELVTAQYNGFNGTTNVYLNNKLFASGTLPTGLGLLQTIPYYIGDDAWASGGYDTFNGSISDVQLYASFLTSAQISNLYSQGMTSAPIGNSGLVGWWPLDGNTNDYSGYNNNGTINYNVSFVNKIFGNNVSNNNVAFINGAQNGINIPQTSSINSAWDGGSWTIVSWIKETAQVAQGTGRSLIQETSGCTSGLWLQAGSSPSTYKILTIEWNSPSPSCASGSGSQSVSSPDIPINTWVMVTSVFHYNSTGASWIAACYDGICNNQTWTLGAPADYASVGYAFVIGGDYCCGGSYFTGKISNTQLYDTALTSKQIKQLYAQGLPKHYESSIPFGGG